MKRISLFTLPAIALLLIAVYAATGIAGDMATKDECVNKVKEAAALFSAEGTDAGIAKLNEANGPFVWKDTYVFLIDLDGAKVLAHPIKPALVGKMLMGLKDVNGKLFFAEFVNKAKTDGEGWVSYMWPKPGEKAPSPKLTYVYRIPGQSMLLAAGIYE